MIELVVFLGNPGSEYAGTRHNAAWILAEQLPFFYKLSWKQKFKGRLADLDASILDEFFEKTTLAEKFSGEHEQTKKAPGKTQFLLPETFMNLSGESLLKAASFFKIPFESILVIHDELELPLGFVSLKFSGGLGGHNGLRSIKEKCGTADFWRLRIGIGRPDDRKPGEGGPPGSGKGIVGWVLSDFLKEEIPVLEKTLSSACDLLTGILCKGPEIFLSDWKKKNVTAEII